MADRIKPGDEVWDVQLPHAPKRCKVVTVEGDWATITWPGWGSTGRWRALLSQLEPVSAVDLLGEITKARVGS